ncbi:hypothetical protein [Fimbriiglobus ruber]|uniref:Uncharacterized protein n=1 Tax=Fimbriiglobus ruber TaxID=1908690 RepID=A0A225DML4_9BACT|nr:hypothetical protein [Fimbriiglobus ruber]OWK38469.1 hypothetical protein FRUB_07589 [Fimbriiglobus ruber]
MRHFSCDICGKDLPPGADPRYVVRVESIPVGPPGELTEGDLDQDHVEAMAELLDELEDGGAAPAPAPVCEKREFDLCQVCHRRFLADPLGRETSRKLQFSKN